MSQAASSARTHRQLLVFPNAAAYAGFLLTCRDTSDLGPQTEIYDQRLSRVMVPRTGNQTLLVAIEGHARQLSQAGQIALANGGHVHEFRSLEPSQYLSLALPQLLRAVVLQPVAVGKQRFDHTLATLRDVSASQLSEFLRQTWDLGVENLEMAFARPTEQQTPTHLIKLRGLRRPEAFRAYCEGLEGRAELYLPIANERGHATFYVQAGYRLPLPGIDQLDSSNRELVLLRYQPLEKGAKTQWITFAAGEVNFFRRAYEFIDAQLNLQETPLVELAENADPPEVPLELAIVSRPRQGNVRLWQLDKQIDRQRRGLLELERQRARLATGKADEVCFAYRFDHEEGGKLNPRFVRFLQQRISTLSHYDYAFCESKRGRKHHLVIANRTQRQLGFTLQLADSTYYQPAAWRDWGIRLFLPLHSELAPRIDDNDALPALQRILGATDDGEVAAAECAAILWEPATDGQINETRVTRAVALLSQFRLINSFQRDVAAEVNQATRARLSEVFVECRQELDENLDALARELFEHVGARVERIETSYTKLENALQAAEQLVAKVEPRIDEVRNLLLTLPDQWMLLMNTIVSLHQSFVDPQLAPLIQLRETVQAGHRQLRAMALRGKNLVQTAEKHGAHIQQETGNLEQQLAASQAAQAEVEQLHVRATRMFQEVAGTFRKLHERLEQTKAKEQRARKMQRQIDTLQRRETEANRVVEQLKPLYLEYQRRAAEIDALEKNAVAEERQLLGQSADLAERRRDLDQRSRQIMAQMARIEVCLRVVGDRSQEIDDGMRLATEQLDVVSAYTDSVRAWDEQQQSWNVFLNSQVDDARNRALQLQQALDGLQSTDDALLETRDLLSHAQQRLSAIELTGVVKPPAKPPSGHP